eukprot:Nk52_evm1s1739 gene=Nk52_evmTU1s1739
MNDPFFVSEKKGKIKRGGQGKGGAVVKGGKDVDAAANNKRKRGGFSASAKNRKGGAVNNEYNDDGKDERDFENESDSDDNDVLSDSGEEEEEEETATEKRLRLAQDYLRTLEEKEREDNSDYELDKDAIAHRLKEDYLQESGKLHRELGDSLSFEHTSKEHFVTFRRHQLPPTAVVFSPDGRFVYSAGKDCNINKWDIAQKKRVYTVFGRYMSKKQMKNPDNEDFDGHTNHILCLAITSDGKYLVSGSKDATIRVFEADCEGGKMKGVHVFRGHRGAVTSLAFRLNQYQLFSGSLDKVVKIWNLEEMAYVDTLYGHQDAIYSVDSLARERAVSCGARDRSIRLWKVIEESQLVFELGGGSNTSKKIGGFVDVDTVKPEDVRPLGCVECVKFINETNFISGCDDGSLSLWSLVKKKPLFRKPRAHIGKFAESWISSLATCPYTDVVASAAADGMVRIWKCTSAFHGMTLLCEFEVKGFVNCMQFNSDCSMLALAVGQESRFGRWGRDKDARNRIILVPIGKKQAS